MDLSVGADLEVRPHHRVVPSDRQGRTHHRPSGTRAAWVMGQVAVVVEGSFVLLRLEGLQPSGETSRGVLDLLLHLEPRVGAHRVPLTYQPTAGGNTAAVTSTAASQVRWPGPVFTVAPTDSRPR